MVNSASFRWYTADGAEARMGGVGGCTRMEADGVCWRWAACPPVSLWTVGDLNTFLVLLEGL